MADETEDLATTGLTDFANVGSAETGENGEATQPEPSPKNPDPNTEEDEADELLADDWTEDPIDDAPETWFGPAGYLRRLFDSRIPRVGHTPYNRSWRYYIAQSKVGIFST